MEDIFAVREARPSAVEGVIEKIKALLIEQKLTPGDMIPNEISLAESLKVGRGTVRDALKILSAYGVVEIKQGYGDQLSPALSQQTPVQTLSSFRSWSRTGTTSPSPRSGSCLRKAL
jgi:DNA-binding GntR family transcriptional regulator